MIVEYTFGRHPYALQTEIPVQLEPSQKAWLNKNCKYLEYQRLDLETETLLDYIENPPKWTDEEVEVWLDWDVKETIKVKRQVQVEFDTHGGLSAERGV